MIAWSKNVPPIRVVFVKEKKKEEKNGKKSVTPIQFGPLTRD